ncbi:MAG: aromatic ring-hydroxylating oxygenase subunit alpha, partial [Candidatus Binataceae bacterium]
MANRRWIKENPDIGAEPVATEPCTSPEFFALEQERVFRRVWLNVGREEEIPQPGDYVVRELPVANTSVLLVRGKDSRIRAFHNVCTHRGNRLVGGKEGSCKKLFVCRFHNWAFDVNGELKWVSDEANFYDIDRSKLGLRTITADTWNGFVFINLDPDCAETLPRYLAGLVDQIGGYSFENQRLMCRYTVEE